MSKKATAGGTDRFGDLTDDLLRHVLSFLPLEDALQTCVLDTRWRNHWRHTATQDFIVDNRSSSLSCERLKQLVKLFIHLRGSSPLDECNIDVCRDDDEKGTYRNTELLIAYALECQVRELLVTVDYFGEGQRKLHKPLISQHLKTIHLEWVKLQCSALNFSRCPVLEDLKMRHCIIYAHRISSKSLKRLCITGSCCFAEDVHTRIFAPNLISLQLDGFDGFPPFIEYMPFLVAAYVGLHDNCFDFCRESDECGCYDCPVSEGVLNGLTNAVNLEFVSENGMFSHLWCSEWFPIFDKLKTLLLNECFMASDLVCILKHTPILEVLTLQLGKPKILIRVTESQETVEQSFVCAHLELVNIECRKVDERIRNILKILSTCGIPRGKISIKDLFSCSNRFSFQKARQSQLPSTAAPVAAVSTIDGT
ncbi:hypothetical protein QYE76_026486 [Lolium multiflorum]|uniref:F-box domain-containing protein n=1 Tax=Lolium multiflorum TaxID=4521 RepID=A0AAD8RJR0_LOLMU|nr:hypothetical protein QYE76_026486 [Lolium multiflorum]